MGIQHPALVRRAGDRTHPDDRALYAKVIQTSLESLVTPPGLSSVLSWLTFYEERVFTKQLGTGRRGRSAEIPPMTAASTLSRVGLFTILTRKLIWIVSGICCSDRKLTDIREPVWLPQVLIRALSAEGTFTEAGHKDFHVCGVLYHEYHQIMVLLRSCQF